MLQEEARHTAIKNITSVLFGICYSARVTGYKYILQRASSPSALREVGAGAGCRAVVVLAPGSRASRAIDALAPGSRASRHRCVTAASTGSVCQPDRLAQGRDMVSPKGPVPFSCLPRPQVLLLTMGGWDWGTPHGIPCSSFFMPNHTKATQPEPRVAQWLQQPSRCPSPSTGAPSPTQAASPQESLPKRLFQLHVLGAGAGVTPRWGKGPSGSNLGGRVDVGEQLTLLLSPHSCQRLQTTGSAFGQRRGQGGHSTALGQW